MNIGFVTTWLERGATYVTKTYMELLAPGTIYTSLPAGASTQIKEKTTHIFRILHGFETCRNKN